MVKQFDIYGGAADTSIKSVDYRRKIAMDILSGAISRHDLSRMEKHAKLYYDAVRRRLGDIEKIAKNTGIAASDIEKIRRHMFTNEYYLGDPEGNLERFAPDYDQSVSWQRLVEGKNIHEMDIVLLRHELMEYNLMRDGLSYDEAHTITNLTYNYGEYIDALDRKAGLK
ncbi:MAG: hypothetical protein LBS84_05065 [Clostridiales bacterium]|nr:hypothetical protein [Clostridiales bacterium]